MTSPLSANDSSMDVIRPPRPPRRISRAFSTSPVSTRDGSVDSTTSQVGQDAKRATHSQLNRLRNESTGADDDVDKTPTKHNILANSPRDEGEADYIRGPAHRLHADSLGRQGGRGLKSRPSGQDADADKVTVSYSQKEGEKYSNALTGIAGSST